MSEEKDKEIPVDSVLKEQFVFRDEIYRLIDEEKNKCIRSILWTAEVILGKNNEEYGKLRKSVLDSVNDFYRKIYATTDKVI